jgi:hypothetical protein
LYIEQIVLVASAGVKLMPFVTRVSLAILSLGLVACATTAQRDLDRMSSRADEVRAAQRECWTRVNSSEDRRVMSDRLLESDSDPRRLEKLALTGRATQKEKIAILGHSRRSMECRKIQIEGWGGVHPVIAMTVLDAHGKIEDISLKLLKDQMDVGAYNAEMLRIHIQHERDWQAAFQEVNSQLQSSHAAEVNYRRAAFSQALQSWSAQQQAIAAQQKAAVPTAVLPNPTVTQCVVVGNVVNCNSH